MNKISDKKNEDKATGDTEVKLYFFYSQGLTSFEVIENSEEAFRDYLTKKLNEFQKIVNLDPISFNRLTKRVQERFPINVLMCGYATSQLAMDNNKSLQFFQTQLKEVLEKKH